MLLYGFMISKFKAPVIFLLEESLLCFQSIILGRLLLLAVLLEDWIIIDRSIVRRMALT